MVGLSRQFELIAPDFLGFGFSDKPKKYPYSINRQADMIEALMAHLGKKQVLLLSHDFGDTVAQELMARQLEGALTFEIKQLMLTNGGLFPEVHRARFMQKLLKGKKGHWFIRFMNADRFHKSFTRIFGPYT